MSRKVRNTDYLCLSAMLRAREARMLGRDKLERMLTEPYADAARTAADCGYEDMAELDIRGINDCLGRHRAAEIAEVYDMCPDKRVVDVFRLKYEYHNAKVIVKSGGAGGELISGSGRSDVEEMRRFYDSGEGAELSPTLSDAIDEAKVTLARTGNPQLADFILDRAYFAELTELAGEIGDGFISEYVKVLIDSANVRIAVRARSIDGGNTAQLANALIPGGTVDADEVRRAMESRDALGQLYANTMFAEAVQQEGMTAFELAADNAVNAFLADSELVSFGPAAIAGYLAAVENEITAIRIILTGRLMGIDPKLLRERLRESYV